MNTIKLSAFRDQGGEIRVSDEYVVTSIDMSDLSYLLKTDRMCAPLNFAVEGKDATVEVYLQARKDNDEGEVEFWRYHSMKTVPTRDGDRLVSITVYND